MSATMLADARAEALFVSETQPSDGLSVDRVRAAVQTAVRRYGVRGCACLVAYEFGEHPEVAAARMRWAHATVLAVFPRRRTVQPPRADITWSRLAVAA